MSRENWILALDQADLRFQNLATATPILQQRLSVSLQPASHEYLCHDGVGEGFA